jgi:hypothetical protein
MAFSVASMVLAEPAADYALIMAAAEPGSRDTKLSQPGDTGMLVRISLLKLYTKDVVGLGPRPLRRGGTVAATHWRGKETRTGVQDSN